MKGWKQTLLAGAILFSLGAINKYTYDFLDYFRTRSYVSREIDAIIDANSKQFVNEYKDAEEFLEGTGYLNEIQDSIKQTVGTRIDSAINNRAYSLAKRWIYNGKTAGLYAEDELDSLQTILNTINPNTLLTHLDELPLEKQKSQLNIIRESYRSIGKTPVQYIEKIVNKRIEFVHAGIDTVDQELLSNAMLCEEKSFDALTLLDSVQVNTITNDSLINSIFEVKDKYAPKYNLTPKLSRLLKESFSITTLENLYEKNEQWNLGLQREITTFATSNSVDESKLSKIIKYDPTYPKLHDLIRNTKFDNQIINYLVKEK